MRAQRLTAIIATASLALAALPAASSHAETSLASDQTIIVSFEKAPSDPAKAATSAIEEAGGEVSAATPISERAVAVTVSSATKTEANRIGEQVEDQSGIKAAETSRRVYPTTTDDTYYSRLWNLNNASSGSYGVDAEDAWTISTGAGSVIGVIDTGITSHSDLSANVITGYDFISDATNAGDSNGWDSDPSDADDWDATDDSSWHGTHVSGTAAATADNGTGVAGVAPKASIEPLRVLGHSGGAESDIIAAITWGAGLSVSGVPTNAHPADVVNLSLGGSGACSVSLQSAIDAAVAAGTAVVVAAGNSGTDLSGTFPANCNNVIRVVATTYEGTLASYSNYGSSTAAATIAAPGGSGESGTDATDWITSTWNSGTTTPGSQSYAGMVGTSMAAPHVSGVIALLRTVDSTLSVSELTSLITEHANALSSTCSTSVCGAGIVDAAASVAAAKGTKEPSVTPVVAKVSISGTARVGKKLTAAATATPLGATLTWQWLRSGVAISGATSSSYTTRVADYGKYLSVRASAAYGSSKASKVSSSVKVSAGTFTKRSSPKVSGTFKVGKKLKAKSGSWSPTASSVTYRWLRDGKSIKSATRSTYKLKKADRRHKISVKITVKRYGYLTASAKSSARKVK